MPKPARSRRRLLVFSLLPGLGLLAGSAIVGELVLRGRYETISAITGAVEWEVGEWDGLTYYWDEYHPDYGWTNRPGYRSDATVPFQVTINQQGLRAGREYSEHPREGRTRLLFFGDSCAFGEEVDDGQTVPHFLEGYLPGSEVLNFGVRGYGVGQMLLRLEQEGFAWNPHHVVFLILVPSDIHRDVVTEFTHPKPSFHLSDGQLVVANQPVPRASHQSWWKRHWYGAAWLWGRPREIAPDPPEYVEDVLPLTGALLDKARSLCEARGVGFTVVHMETGPTFHQMARDPEMRDTVNLIRGELNQGSGTPLDLSRFLAQLVREGARELVAPRGHWNAEGNCLIAGKIAEHLVEQQVVATLAKTGPDCRARSDGD